MRERVLVGVCLHLASPASHRWRDDIVAVELIATRADASSSRRITRIGRINRENMDTYCTPRPY